MTTIATVSTARLWAVVPAGGAGTRLWPLSRRDRPKFLLDLTGAGRSLLQQTTDRLRPLTGDRMIVVTGLAHRAAVAAQLPELPASRILAEPSPRDSMAAIGLAAAVLEALDPEAVLGSFAADHVIADSEAFRLAIRAAVPAAEAGWLVTIGLRPTSPATGFGYIRPGAELAEHEGVRAAAEFVEKPGPEVAQEYVSAGYRWNAGMFVGRPGVILDLLADSDPEFAANLRDIAAQLPDRPEVLDERWPTLPRIAFDHAIAEPAATAGRVAVVEADLGWDDIGDFASLEQVARSLRKEESPVVVVGEAGHVVSRDSSGLVVAGTGRTVAIVGLDDIVVVDTPDAVLVTSRSRAQDVKALVEEFRAQGREDLT